MTPIRERIFNLLRRAPDGISGDDLFAIIYDGQLRRYQGGNRGTRQRTALKAHIWHLNQELKDCRITGRGGYYRLLPRLDRRL
jgi:hypothetical protein